MCDELRAFYFAIRRSRRIVIVSIAYIKQAGSGNPRKEKEKSADVLSRCQPRRCRRLPIAARDFAARSITALALAASLVRSFARSFAAASWRQQPAAAATADAVAAAAATVATATTSRWCDIGRRACMWEYVITVTPRQRDVAHCV